MEIGKLPGERLEKLILNRTGKRREDVLVHSGLGEDTAVVDLGDELLAISSDPITGAASGSGRLAVHVSCNDLAAAGAVPVGLQVILLLPPGTADEELAGLMGELDQSCRSLGIEILGGHTEIVSAVTRPIIVVTAVGKVERGKQLSSAGARPGDELLLTKGLGIEGTYILASDYGEALQARGVSREVIAEARGYIEKISVLKEGLLAAEYGAHAMHDVTEGGLYGALDELSRAAGCGFDLEREKLPVSKATAAICRALEIDPAGLISSGSMLIAIPRGKDLLDRLTDEGIEAALIGRMTAAGRFISSGGKREEFHWSGKDELWRLMQKNSIFS